MAPFSVKKLMFFVNSLLTETHSCAIMIVELTIIVNYFTFCIYGGNVMNSNTVSKINTLGKVGYIISKIAKILALVGAVICLVSGILCCFVPNDFFTVMLESTNTATVTFDGGSDFFDMIDLGDTEGFIEIDGNKFALNGGVSAPEGVSFKTAFTIINIRLLCFFGAVSCVLLFIPFLFAEKLCNYFKNCETPFTESASRSLTELAWSLIPVCAVGSLAESISGSLISNVLDIQFNIDLTTVLLILCIFMLSFIFKYGTVLQTESDETL